MKLLTLALFATTLFAYSPDYFPLQVGNQWVYRTTFAGASSFTTVSVTRGEEHNGRQYAVVEGLAASPTALRQADDGTLYAWDGAADQVWEAFATPEGGEFATTIDNCTPRGKVASRSAKLDTPAGYFAETLQVQYAAACADAGITSDHFAPWIGLVRRETTSFAGPRVMELVYSRTGGVTQLAQPETAFSLALSASSVPQGTERIDTRLTLRVTSGAVTLDFPSAQRFDLQIRNERGEVVYTWSATRLFAAVLGQETIRDGERNWADSVPVADLAPGRYTVEGWLTTAGEARRWWASVGFDVAARR